MAYNTKPIVTDKDGNPISQYYNPATDSYEPVEGSSGGNKVVVENNDLSLIPILDKLSQLTGTVIDEETRKSNELGRISKESARVTTETSRVNAESTRVSNENIRKSNETARQSQETTRESNEDLRIALYDDLLSKVASGFFKGVKGDTGNGLEYTWNDTQLGVRIEGDSQYVFVDLKGEKGETGNIANLTSDHITDALGYTPLNEDTLPSNLETTTGSQAKADVAEQNAKNYTDIELASFEGMVEHGNEYHTAPYAKESDLVAHKADDVSQEKGVHGIRFKDKSLQYFDIETQEWKQASPPLPKIYGVEIDESNSNPETSVVYTDDAIGFIPASGNNGNFTWGSWESIIKDEFKIRPCVLNNPAKTVNYYLDYDDYTKKATGGASVLTGIDGDVMTEFGTDIYTKWTVVGSKHNIQFSIKPFEGATKNAFETENGYNQFAYYPLLLTQKLFQMIFKNRDSQTALGRGYVDESSAYATTGNTNTKGFMFGETTGKQQMKFLGIEDYWGNKYQWIDGLVTDASFNLLIGNSGFNDSGSGYTSYSSGVSANLGGYIAKVQGGNDKGFIIRTESGSATTHYCDYGYLGSGRVARFGGGRSVGSAAGFARLLLSYAASIADVSFGARLMCVNNGKLYIGAYLGTTQGGKLRSVSGTTPSDSKTISVFRNEAKANNI